MTTATRGAALLALLAPALAQGGALASARSFAGWMARMTTPVLHPGPATITVQPGFIVSADGQLAPALSESGYVTVDANGAAETVQTTGVACTQSPVDECQAEANFVYPHLGTYVPVQSATHGLQEAIAYMRQRGGGGVILDAGFGADNSMLAKVVGINTVFLVDWRASGPGYYLWTGSSFQWTIPSSGGVLDSTAPQITAQAIEGTRYSDQYPGGTVGARVTAACAALAGNPGVVAVPAGGDASPLPALPPACVVRDERGNTGNGGVVWERALAGNEQYGFSFAATSLSGDGESATALLGEVPAGVSGSNVVGVRGQVFSSQSAAVYGVNFGSAGQGGPGVQGDIPNLPGGVGVLGTGCSSGSTAADPCIGVFAHTVGNPVYGANLPLVAAGDNGPAAVFTSAAAPAAGIDPQVLEVKSALDTSTSISNLNLSVGGRRWDWRSTGAADPCTGAAGFSVLFNATDNACAVLVAPTAANGALRVDSNGLSTAGALISTLATGAPPLQVASTTPVANLTTAPTVYSSAGTQLPGAHLVRGSCIAGSNCSITLAGAAAFASAADYACTANDADSPSAVQVQVVDGTHVTLLAPAADHVAYLCVGSS